MEIDRPRTPRQALRTLLQEQDRSVRELSQLLSLPEKEVLGHLDHLAKAPGPGCQFVIGGMHLTLVHTICSILLHGGIPKDHAGI